MKAIARIPSGYGAAIIFITMALVVLAYAEMHRIKTAVSRIAEDTMPSIYLSGQLQSVTLLRYTLLTDYVDPNDSPQRALLNKQIDTADSQIDEIIAQYDSLIDSPADRRLFENLKSTRAPYDECFNQVLRLSREGHLEEAQNLIGTQLIPLRNAFLKAAEAEVVWNKADADNSIVEITKAVNWTATSFLFCLVLSAAVACAALGIRKRFQIERMLRESEDRLQEVFEQAADGIVITDVRGSIQFANPAFTAMTGYSCEEAVGQNPRLLKSGRTSPAGYKELWNTILSGRVWHGEVVNRRKDGSLYDEEMRIAPLHNSMGAINGFIAIKREVTERKQAEQALHESENRFRIMADSCPIGIWVTDALGKEAFINRVYREFIGVSSNHIDESEWLTRVHQDDVQEFTKHFKRAHQQHTNFKAEIRTRRWDGEWRWMNSFAEPRISSNGEFRGLVGIDQDITERRQVEQSLQSSEEKFRQLAENIREVFWMMNAAGTEILYVGPAYEEIWGRSCASLYASPMDWLEAIHLDDRESAHATFMRQLQGERIDSEYRITTPNGQERWIRDRAFPVRDQSGELIRIAGIAEDITERKKSEIVLRRTTERLVLATRAGGVGIWENDLVNNVLVWDDQMFRLYGTTRDQFGCAYQAWLKGLYPEDRQRMNEKKEAAIRGEKEIDDEFRVVWPNGAIHHIRALAQVKRDASGKAVHIIGTNWDITAEKQAAEALLMSNRQLELETSRANQLAIEAKRATAAKSEFLANMSHEIRTPMNGIIGMNGLLLDTELTAEQRRYAELARRSGESLLHLINDILDFSKIEAKKLELETIDFDLRSLLDNLAAVLGATAQGKGIEVLCVADPAVPAAIRGDPSRLRQILTNLAGNAIKFTDRGKVVVRAALAAEEGSDCMLRFSVCDTGIGIREDKIGVLFEKFSQVEVSTTRKYGGTGLGLAISKQLVEMMGGRIGVTSKKGEGSKFWFTVRLERSLGLAAHAEGSQLDGQTTARLNGRILIAEDNSTNREVALGLLRKLGLRVDAVADGAEAVRALESIPYDLVLMDMRMPVMDGVEAARQIRNPQSAVLHHDIPIIALTANAMQSDRLNCLAAGMNDFVPKPIMQGVLRDVLQKWLPAGDSETPNAANPFKPVQMNEKDVKVFDPVSVWSRLEGDNELVKIVFEAFLADIPSQIEALKELVKRGDRAGAALQAHSIRGASASVGGESLRKLAAQMEKAADSGDWRLVVTRMDELERQFNLLKSAIEADRPVCMK